MYGLILLSLTNEPSATVTPVQRNRPKTPELTKMSKMTGKMGKFDIKKQKCVLLVCDIQDGNLLKKILNEKKVRYVKRSPRRRFGSKRISQQIRSISHG